MSKHLRWESHKGHWELLKEFYYFNKYFITEQLKDALLDAMECMEYTMNEKGESYKEEGKKYHMPKDDDTGEHNEVNKPDGNCLDCKFQYLEDSDYWCSICPGNPEDI